MNSGLKDASEIRTCAVEYMTATRPVLIVGAGPTGMTAAIYEGMGSCATHRQSDWWLNFNKNSKTERNNKTWKQMM
jgi:hypothetical protein